MACGGVVGLRGKGAVFWRARWFDIYFGVF